MNLRLWVRMAQLARHPPPLWRVILGAVVIAICLALAGIEWLGYWPDGLVVDDRKGRLRP